jgi:hypothetical protein
MKPALLRLLAVTAGTITLVLCAAFAPIALRAIDGFAVRRVEVIGARHLTAEAAVAASGVTPASNLFDDPNPWLDALQSHPLIAEVRIERRLPGTLVLRVSETVPVAFARTPELRAIDHVGRMLPADPARDDMDLPVLSMETRVSASGLAVDEPTQVIVAFLGIVARTEPALLGWISEAGVRGDAVRLVLRHAPRAEVLLPAAPTADRLRELYITLEELAATPGLPTIRRVDARFDGQVVVGRYTGKN